MDPGRVAGGSSGALSRPQEPISHGEVAWCDVGGWEIVGGVSLDAGDLGKVATTAGEGNFINGDGRTRNIPR